MGIDVRPLAFGKPVYKERLCSPPEEDDRPVAARPSLPTPGDPLLDDFATQVGVDLAFVSAIRSLLQRRVRDSLLSCEALKPPGLEDSPVCPAAIL
jgi:hypothetical protein